MQVEYATDLVFRSAAALKPLYDRFVRESVLNVKAEQAGNVLGRESARRLAQEVGSRFSIRIEGTCIRHRFGGASIKMCDKFGRGRRYLEHLFALDDFPAGVRTPDRVTKPRVVDDKTVKGINFFHLTAKPCFRRRRTRG